ncbi:MAG: flagellar hook-basal body complex protein FliE [Clostridiales bacterium]|jgi:flagellar hook-basal body complex protein FliE|nr:flagellar hook-basal body complex protein FliE [Clostridiales bacterium]
MDLNNKISPVAGGIDYVPDILSTKENNNAFKDIYDAYLGVYNTANEYQNDLAKAQVDFAVGETDDMLSVMLAQEKAYASLNFAVQVTNKVMESYREIMRIQL